MTIQLRAVEGVEVRTPDPGSPLPGGQPMSVVTPSATASPVVLSPDDLAVALRQIAARRYHNHHPFHQLLHSGRLSKAQVRAWALNRTYYQAMIPVKDAIILSRLASADDRRRWVERITDHDGAAEGQGAMARWLKLTDGLGLDRDFVLSGEGVLPGTRFAVDAYVSFVEKRSVLEGIAAALTEIFAPTITEERVSGMLAGYDFISPETMTYFARRLNEPNRHADFTLSYVTRHARDAASQAAAMAAVKFKCDVLWAMLDALGHAYVAPGALPPGAPSFDDP